MLFSTAPSCQFVSDDIETNPREDLPPSCTLHQVDTVASPYRSIVSPTLFSSSLHDHVHLNPFFGAGRGPVCGCVIVCLSGCVSRQEKYPVLPSPPTSYVCVLDTPTEYTYTDSDTEDSCDATFRKTRNVPLEENTPRVHPAEDRHNADKNEDSPAPQITSSKQEENQEQQACVVSLEDLLLNDREALVDENGHYLPVKTRQVIFCLFGLALRPSLY